VQAAAALMGLPNRYNYHSQFFFGIKKDNRDHHEIMPVVTVPAIIGAATAVVTGSITGTAVYLTSGDADVVSGDQFKTEGGLLILELDHPEPWVIDMICITILIGMGTCGASCHKQGKKCVTDKEAKVSDCALGRAKELVHMGAHGADKLLQYVQTYHDMHLEIVQMKMHQITPPRSGGRYGEKPCENPQCSLCPKPRHMVIAYSSSSQEATMQQVQKDSSRLPPLTSSVTLKSRVKRQIAAMTPSPPRIVTAPSNLFDNAHKNNTNSIFLT
jgi:hypothetical protein